MEEQGSIFNVYFLNLIFSLEYFGGDPCCVKLGAGNLTGDRSCRANNWSVY